MFHAQKFMRIALTYADQSRIHTNVPVGVVITHKNSIIATAYNMMHENKCALDHAELLCLKKALSIYKTPFLENCDMYVTLEPCHMCAGAIAHSRIRRLYYGAYDPKGGNVDHNSYVLNHSLHKPEVYGGILEKESGIYLKDFFKKLRF
jgi:tRNA(adenine34) deaminase